MSGKRRNVQHSMQGAFVFVLLGLFAVMSTLMVLLGAQMYHNTVERSTQNNEDRVLSAYVRSMVRAQDTAASVSVQSYDGVKALTMVSEEDERAFTTWLYCYDGWLYEHYTGGSDTLSPEKGTAICPARSFEPVIEGNLLTVKMTDADGARETVRVALHCAE